jgi:hypothetical protein
MPQARKGLGKLQPEGTRVLASRLDQADATKAM